MNLLKLGVIILIFSVITSCEENTKNCNNCGSKNSIITRYGQFGKYYICSQCRVCIPKEELEKELMEND